ALDAGRFDALRVGLAVDEAERVARDELGVVLDERSLVDEQLEPVARGDLEVVLALGADAVVPRELLVEQHLAAVGALRPEMRRQLVAPADRHAQPHVGFAAMRLAAPDSSGYQHSPMTPGPARAPMTGPASARKYSTQ